MDELSNDYELENIENEECEDEEDEEEIELITSSNNNQPIKSNKRKLSSDSKYCKKRKCRTTFSKSQLSTLEKEFLSSNFISNDRIDLVIELTGLDSRIIKNWFKNKRSRVLSDTKTNPLNGSVKPGVEVPPATILTNSASLNSKPVEQQKVTTSHGQTFLQPQQQQQLFVQTSNLSSNFKENRLVSDNSSYSQGYNSTHSHNAGENAIYIHTEHSSKTRINSSKGKNNEMLANKSSNGLLNILNTNDIQFKSDQEKKRGKSIQKGTGKLNTKKESTTKAMSFDSELFIDYKDSVCPICLKLTKLFCSCNVSVQALKKLYSNLIGYDMRFLNKNEKPSERSFQILGNVEGFQKRIALDTNCTDLLLDIDNNDKSFEIL